MYEALVLDLVWLKETKNIGKVASRMNRKCLVHDPYSQVQLEKQKTKKHLIKESLIKVKKKSGRT